MTQFLKVSRAAGAAVTQFLKPPEVGRMTFRKIYIIPAGAVNIISKIPQVNKVMPDGTREKINFYVYYAMDEAEVKTLLRAE